jgi:hypothetical protein
MRVQCLRTVDAAKHCWGPTQEQTGKFLPTDWHLTAPIGGLRED